MSQAVEWAIDADEQAILFTILADLETLAELPDDALATGSRYRSTLLRVGLPFASAEWSHGPLAPRRRMAFSRAARRLESRGLVRRVTEKNRDRAVALVPTPDGLARALELAGDRADCGAVREGLRRTHWGTALANAI